MSQFSVCVYAICKNEAAFADRWMDSMLEADAVYVTDTGSTDDSVERLRSRGAVVFETRIEPWRFDTARNVSLSQVPQNTDICVCTDLDERFEPGWRHVLESAWAPGLTRLRYPYVFSHTLDGSPEHVFEREKIHSRSGCRWVRPVHEVLVFEEEIRESSVYAPGLTLHHEPDVSKSRGQYLPLLEVSAREAPEDDRTMFWLGREYFYHQRYEDCISTLKQHLKLPGARWDEERSASMRFIGDACAGLSRAEEAKGWYYRAAAECPRVREPLLRLAQMGCDEQNWPLTYAMAKNALAVKEQTGSYLTEPASWGSLAYDLCAVGAYYLGLYTESRDMAASALALKPGDKRLAENFRRVSERLTAESR